MMEIVDILNHSKRNASLVKETLIHSKGFIPSKIYGESVEMCDQILMSLDSVSFAFENEDYRMVSDMLKSTHQLENELIRNVGVITEAMKITKSLIGGGMNGNSRMYSERDFEFGDGLYRHNTEDCEGI
jgi:hypothetical protein